jgi:hypothetical protein
MKIKKNERLPVQYLCALAEELYRHDTSIWQITFERHELLGCFKD